MTPERTFDPPRRPEPSLAGAMLLGAAAGGLGWGIRGQYGHETGAMIPGLLVGLVAVRIAMPGASSLRAARAVALCALGFSVGGSMTYGQTVGLTQDPALIGNSAALAWGMLGLALKGGIWIGIGGALLGMGIGERRYRSLEALALVAALTGLLLLGRELLDAPFNPEHHRLPALYFSADWRWLPDSVDLRSRPKRWGGLLLAFGGLLAYLAVVKRDRAARACGWTRAGVHEPHPRLLHLALLLAELRDVPLSVAVGTADPADALGRDLSPLRAGAHPFRAPTVEMDLSPQTRPPARLIVANLDAECDLARAAARLRAERGEPAPPPDDPRFALPQRVIARLAALGTLLRAFARQEDEIWLPREVAPERVPEVAGLPRPRLLSGPPQAPRREGGAILAWCETEETAAMRARGSESGSASESGGSGSVADLLWRAPRPPASAVVAANHRSLALALARDVEGGLEEARIVRGEGEIEEAARGGGAEREWVLKPPHSAGGRTRVRWRGERLAGAAARRARELLSLHGELSLEPWVERTADFGIAGVVLERSEVVLGTHRLLVTRSGLFRGIQFSAAGPAPGLRADEEDALQRAFAAAARRLRSIGYRGPVAIDSFRWRDAAGRERFRAVSELNVRIAFSFVARAIVERVEVVGGGRLNRPRLVVATAGEARLEPGERRPPLALLPPGPPDGLGAWLCDGLAPGGAG